MNAEKRSVPYGRSCKTSPKVWHGGIKLLLSLVFLTARLFIAAGEAYVPESADFEINVALVEKQRQAEMEKAANRVGRMGR